QMRQQQRSHGGIEVDYVALGVAVSGIKNLVQIGELEPAALNGQRDFIAFRRQQRCAGCGCCIRSWGRFLAGLLENFLRIAVNPQALKHWSAQAAITGPRVELHHTDQLGFDPGDSANLTRDITEYWLFCDQWFNSVVDCFERLLRKS